MREARDCAFGVAPKPVEGLPLHYSRCSWGAHYPIDHLPPFVQRAAMAGGVNVMDCETCKCFRPRA